MLRSLGAAQRETKISLAKSQMPEQTYIARYDECECERARA